MKPKNLEILSESLDTINSSLDVTLDHRFSLNEPEEKKEMRNSDKVKIYIEQAVKYAESWLGTYYKWGGEAIGDGVDCSGLVRRILFRCMPGFPGKDMTAQGIMDQLITMGFTCKQDGEAYEAATGDILFFGRDIYHISHVAFASSPFHMIEAGGGGRKTRTKEEAIAQGAWVRINLIEKRRDLVCRIDPWEYL